MFVPGRPSQSSLMFVGKARSLPQTVASERTRLEKPVRDKHCSLLQTFVKYGFKKFSNIVALRGSTRDQGQTSALPTKPSLTVKY